MQYPHGNSAVQIVTVSEAEPKLLSKKEVLLKQANDLVITSDDECAQAVDFIKAVKGQAKIADEERRKLVDPINGAVKNINERFRGIISPLEQAEKIVKEKVLEYTQYKEALRREELERQRQAEEKARKDAEEAQRAAAATQVAEGSFPTPVDRSLPPPDQHILQPNDLTLRAPVAEAVRVRGDSGGLATVKKVWKYEVTDILELAKMHPEAVQPNHEAVMHCIRNGVRMMPGLRIYQEDVLQVR
jgi:hypothetical protein